MNTFGKWSIEIYEVGYRSSDLAARHWQGVM